MHLIRDHLSFNYKIFVSYNFVRTFGVCSTVKLQARGVNFKLRPYLLRTLYRYYLIYFCVDYWVKKKMRAKMTNVVVSSRLTALNSLKIVNSHSYKAVGLDQCFLTIFWSDSTFFVCAPQGWGRVWCFTIWSSIYEHFIALSLDVTIATFSRRTGWETVV